MSSTTDGAYCQHCGRFLRARKMEIMHHEITIGYEDCPCPDAVAERERQAQEEKERQARERQAKAERAYKSAGIPKHFWQRIIKAPPPAISMVATGGSLYLVGDVGCGKTTYACQVAKDLIDCGEKSVQFLPAADLSPMVRSSYRRDSKESENDIVNRYASCRILILDDLGKDGTTDHAIGALERIIDRRYRDELSIIVTTQYERAELIEHLSKNGNLASAKAIVSRLKEMCHRVRFENPDRRLNGEQLRFDDGA